MRKIGIALILGCFIFSCTKKEKGEIVLKENTPEYRKAHELAVQIPYLDPQLNNPLVKTKQFVLTIADVVLVMQQSPSNVLTDFRALNKKRKKEVIEGMASDIAIKKLLVQKAAGDSIVVTEADIDSVLANDFKEAGGRVPFLRVLKDNKISYRQLKEDIKNIILIERHLQKNIYDEIRITEDEIQEAYRKDRVATVRHILKRTVNKSDSVQNAKIRELEDLRNRAIAGEDFGELAKEYSEEPGAVKNGGLYKNIQKGVNEKAFDEAAFSTPVGEVSSVFQTIYGHHILKVVSRKKEVRSLKQVRDELIQEIQKQKQDEIYSEYIEKLKIEAEFEVIPIPME